MPSPALHPSAAALLLSLLLLTLGASNSEPGRSQAWASFHSHLDQGRPAAARPLPVWDPRAIARPGASLALPACPSSEPPSIADPAPGLPSPALGPCLVAQANPSGLRHSLPCPSVCRSSSLAPEAAAVSSLCSALGRRAGLGAPRLSVNPPAPFPCSPIHWATLAHRRILWSLGTRGLSGRYRRPRAVNQVRWPRAWPPCLRPGLPTSGPRPQAAGLSLPVGSTS